MYLSVDSETPEKFTFETDYKLFLSFNRINQRKQKWKERLDSESDEDIPKKKKTTPATAVYDSDESLSSSSDDEPVKRKKKRKRTDWKDPFKAIEELEELLISKTSSESTTVDLGAMKKPVAAFPLDSFEALQATREPDVTGEQKITIGELR